ncbi:hypothetical protein [Flagellimonas nanhaiensis]|uniref:Uncharacterized protein n=1 Tax=Flagellimonas nanhaiensis TaxID=2292706 RepID=A0A371JQZ9_9FLAO|nr:hypothetical protein [Allomuricauda nanhaiensis]RDY59934.1 hypothetical protein DX873_11335 [Allomuricauda nanhaiensis]
MRISPLVLFVFLVSSHLSFGQWTRKAGDGYYKLSAWYLEADQHFSDTGEIEPNTTRSQFNINLYAEYGLTDRWNLIGYIPFFARAHQDDVFSGITNEPIAEGESVNSIGDIDLGVTYGIIKKDALAVSATLLFGIPSGNDSGGIDGTFQTGDGEFNQLLKVDAGTPFNIGNHPSYAKTYLGFNNRTQDFSDELRVGAELGIQFFNSLWVAGKLDVVQSLQNGSLNVQNDQGSLFANNIEFVGLSFEAAYYITPKLGVSATYGTALDGRIIYADPSFAVGVFLDVK